MTLLMTLLAHNGDPSAVVRAVRGSRPCRMPLVGVKSARSLAGTYPGGGLTGTFLPRPCHELASGLEPKRSAASAPLQTAAADATQQCGGPQPYSQDLMREHWTVRRGSAVDLAHLDPASPAGSSPTTFCGTSISWCRGLARSAPSLSLSLASARVGSRRRVCVVWKSNKRESSQPTFAVGTALAPSLATRNPGVTLGFPTPDLALAAVESAPRQ